MSDITLTPNAIKILERRYLGKDENGNLVETPEALFHRVANNIALADSLYNSNADIDQIAKEFFNMMIGLEFLPNSPTLMNAGKELQQLSACFVLPVEDSLIGIFETVKNSAVIHQSGGGTGFSFSRIRPTNDMVKSTSGVSSGPISFMKVFNAATETIKQGGKRRGANMGILSVTHPDIMEFIDSKTSHDELNNFNISVALTEEFMNALESKSEYALTNPRNEEVVKSIPASIVFDRIVNNAWENGEPGIIFIDRINSDNPTPHIGKIESTNPCGEQPLLPYESCNLGSINLSVMVKGSEVDWERIKKTTHLAVHFLDNVIDMNNYPLPAIEKFTKGNRKIGLGIMGWADMLIKLGIPYNSNEAINLAENLMGFINNESKIMSEQLSHERGVFPNFSGSIYDGDGGRNLRNATTTTIAPTGTISMIADVSSGIEPLFALVFRKNVMDNDSLLYVNEYFASIMKERGLYSEDLLQQIARNGSLQGIEGIPDDIKNIFITAHDISPYWHIQMQSAFQKHVDNAVSKTVNFPNSATKEDIAEVYKLAYATGCKGVTVYRDGSRSSQVVTMGKGELMEQSPIVVTPRPRAFVTTGSTMKMKTGCGNLYITINEDAEGLFEVFTTMGKAGGCAASQSEAISRMISLALRSHIKPNIVITQLKGIRCPNPKLSIGGAVFSCPDAIGKAMEQYLAAKMGGVPIGETKTIESFSEQSETVSNLGGNLGEIQPNGLNSLHVKEGENTWMMGICPDCGSPLFYEEGCAVCRICAFSKCG